ncbi:hypothetical protein P0O24_11655 [Methanotrichaceae archaeon M04Ac]|uniref:DUF4145 domain-containing protein n=1 Tax=Candidatus Methanocrinis alkalitolerans TaxID=3033395 RepID=A0ABT5XHR9_9EURY|nr:hypothetical protein [Candidatus Methanocrinis alkalitolerans]MDF0594236.1 hypothetical protein [Candidatus Methanocrinis alkalitolerans]
MIEIEKTKDASGTTRQKLKLTEDDAARFDVTQWISPVTDTEIDVQNLLSIELIEDEFYKKLIDEINALYNYKFPTSLYILIRKLLENLLIEILRKKYGTREIELYFNIHKNRFNDFSVLLDNFELKLNDFKTITSGLDADTIAKMRKYKKTGNAAAHSIDTNITIDKIRNEKDDINFIVNLLLRLWRTIV